MKKSENVPEKYSFLNPKVVKIKGVNELFEKLRGMMDAKGKQVCVFNEGHITPAIDSKVNSFDSHINDIMHKTARELEPMICEANSMVTELNIILNYKAPERRAVSGVEALREADHAVRDKEQNKKRKNEILTRLASIRAESDMIHEMLVHYKERAEAFLHARISKYWGGVLLMADGKLEHFPCVCHRDMDGEKVYAENRGRLISILEKALMSIGGEEDEEK